MHRAKLLGIFFLFFILAISTTSAIPDNQFFPGGAGDFGYHAINIHLAIESFQSRHFWLRTAPDIAHGWIYPAFIFYAPFAYTIAGLIGLLDPHQVFQFGYKYTLILAATLGAFYNFRFYLRLFKNEIAALLGATLYLFSPYLLININVRGDFTEAFSQCILPIALYYLYCLYTEPPVLTRQKIPLFLTATLAYYCFMTSHVITFLYGSFFIALWFISLALHKRQLASLKPLLLCGLASLCLAAWYIGPVLLVHHTLVIADSLADPWSLAFITTLPTLLSPKALSVAPGFGLFALDPGVGIPVILSVGYWIYHCYLRRPKLTTEYFPLIKTTLWLFLLAFFMAWTPFDFWRFLPHNTHVVQFSYRILTNTMWLGGILFVAMLVHVFEENKLNARHCLLGLFLIPLANSQWMTSNYLDGATTVPLTDINNLSLSNPLYHFDYLVSGSRIRFKGDPDTTTPLLPVATVQPQCQKQGLNLLHCTLKSTIQTQQIQLPILYYPYLLKVSVNGKTVPYYPTASTEFYLNDPQLPLLLATIKIPAETAHIEACFTGLRPANLISAISWMIFILAGVVSFLWRKKWVL